MMKILTSIFIALVIGVLTFSTPSLAASNLSVSDIQSLINQTGTILQGLGITPKSAVTVT
jgi:hypothetical protein